MLENTRCGASAGAMKRRDELLVLTADQRFLAYLDFGNDDQLEAAAKRVEGRIRDLLNTIDPPE